MRAYIRQGEHGYQDRISVFPTEKHYEEKGERPYIKYGCPVCRAAGARTTSIPYREGRCQRCGVSLDWGQPKAGDTAMLVSPVARWEAGSWHTVMGPLEPPEDAPAGQSWWRLMSRADGWEFACPADAFSTIAELE